MKKSYRYYIVLYMMIILSYKIQLYDYHIYEARSKLVAQAWFEMHDYRSLGGALSFLKVLLKLSGSPGNKLLYVLLYNPIGILSK